MNTTYIKATAAGGGTTLSTAQLMKTGQTTSYRTGDDGDLESGRNVDFFTLAENNPFGNTNRFTDELGGQTYTNNIVIDWSTYNGSTVLGWRRTALTASIVVWTAAIDGALAVSIGTFTTGWRLPNINELYSIKQIKNTINVLNYAPFNLIPAIVGALWSSTKEAGSTTNSLRLITTVGTIDSQGSATSANYIPCRTFTVTGTTLS
jgi:hypothetical protein